MHLRRFLHTPPTAIALAAVAVLGVVLLGRAGPVQAQQSGCVAEINGQDVSGFGSYRDAIELRYTDTVTLALGSNQGLGDVRVNIAAGPYSDEVDPLNAQTANQGAVWIGEVSLEDYARYGIGLYEVTMTSSSGCDQTLWVNVTGKSAIATVAGSTATAVLLLGVLAQIIGFLLAIRRGRGRWLAILGGIPVGLGATMLSQQAGLTPIAPEWGLIWTLPPMAFGGVVQGGLSALFRSNRGPELMAGPPEFEPEPELVPAPPATAEPPSAPPPPPPAPQGLQPAPQAPTAPPASEPLPPPSLPPQSAPTTSAPADFGAPSSGQQQQQQQQQQQARPPQQQQQQMAPPPDSEEEIHAANGGGGGARSGARRSAIGESSEDLPRDPPRTSYALLDCPSAVVAQDEFELSFGLSPVEVAGVAGPALVRPASSIGSYFLTVQIVAEGFDIRDGEHWRHELPVTADSPYPTATIHLTPRPQTDAVRSAAIQAIYSVSGQSMGFAVRPVAIVASTSVAPPAPDEAMEGATISVPTDEPAADLTVRIQHGEVAGTLLWTFDSPHPLVPVPDEPLITDIGDDPKAFARKLVDQMGNKEGQPGIYLSLAGIGKTVADQMPPGFWDLLEAVADATTPQGGLPSLFILSEDPYIPWELALVRKRLDPALPEFLGAQASVGRWALGKQRPKLPPPNRAEVDSVAVIWGEYNQPGWNRLLEAEKEAADITAQYAAINVNAARLDVLRCLNGTPEADVLHFAVHGIYDPNSVMNGIVLVDGNFLDEFEVRGSNLGHAPFVFLNACQVGSGQAILGDYGGMAHAFLYAGAGGVIAPLWSIKDSIARDIATRFYAQAFEGVPPAEILRRERATFQENLDAVSATCMAYIWYGHPSFTLKRLQGDGQ